MTSGAQRRHVAQARAAGAKLNLAERFDLKARLVLAHVLRADIRLNQRLKRRFGLTDEVTTRGLSFSAGTAAGEALLAIRLANRLNESRFGQFDRALSYTYEFIKSREVALRRDRVEAAVLRGRNPPRPGASEGLQATEEEFRLAQLDRNINEHLREITTARTKVSTLRQNGSWFERSKRPLRLTLGAVVVPVAVIEGGFMIYQVAVDPRRVSTLERELTDFIERGQATLEAP